jgi:hypothetical protein
VSADNEYIEIFGAREHNLKEIDLKIPRNQRRRLTFSYIIQELLFKQLIQKSFVELIAMET